MLYYLVPTGRASTSSLCWSRSAALRRCSLRAALPYTTLTHMHTLTGQHAFAAALLFTCACYTDYRLLTCIHTYVHL